MTADEIVASIDRVSLELSKLRVALCSLPATSQVDAAQPAPSKPLTRYASPRPINCEHCGRSFLRTGNRQRMCPDCGGRNRKRPAGAVVACACGCGASFEKYDGQGRARRFILGHSVRPPKHVRVVGVESTPAPVFELPIDGFVMDDPPRQPGRPAKVLRQSNAPTVRSADDSSWWTKPNADFAKEAERMKGRGPRIGSEDRIIGMRKRDFFG